MPYYVGKHSSGVTGAASTWGRGGRSLRGHRGAELLEMEGLWAREMLLASTVLREILSYEAKSFFLSEQSTNRPALYHSSAVPDQP